MVLRVCSVFCVLLGLSGIDAVAQDRGQNLIDEPSFEGDPGAGGLPAGWYGIHTMPDGGYQFDIVGEAHSGEHALHMQGRGEFGVAWGEKLRIDRGRQYRVRGWVKVEGDAGAAADVKFHYHGTDQQYLGQSRIGWVNPRTDGWQLITVTCQTELFPDAEYISIAVALAGDGEAWFDDVELFVDGEKPDSVNYVANGDMEDVAADRPAGWFVVVSEGDHGECSIETENPHEGQRCLHLTGSGEWCAAGSVQIPVEPNREYELTGFVRASRGSAGLAVGYFKDGELIGDTIGEVDSSESWKTHSVGTELANYPNATHFNAVVIGEGDFESWFDDLKVTASE